MVPVLTVPDTKTDRASEARNVRQRAVLYQLFPIEAERDPFQWCVGPGARLVGRRCGPDQIELPCDPLVSSRHASITNDGGKFALCDENSRNGTFVNRRKISPLHPFLLTDNDVIRVGGTLLLFRLLQDDVPFCTDTPSDFVVRSLEMHDVLHYARQATARGGAILILGESGTGKEKVARYIHAQSAKTKQRTGPLIAVNCATLTPELATSALFGHRKGSFTGAHADHQGFFVAADNGTLFLDEIGEVPTTVQAHLLRALAEKKFVPVGATTERNSDVLLVAATNRDLHSATDSHGFRADLLARISTHCIELPPLRKRREEILPLLLSRFPNGSIPTLDRELAELLVTYGWPLNIREVFNLAEYWLTRYPGQTQFVNESLPSWLAASVTNQPAKDTGTAASSVTPQGPSSHSGLRPTRAPQTTSAERMEKLLAEHCGNVSSIARVLSLSPRQVGRILDTHGLEPHKWRGK